MENLNKLLDIKMIDIEDIIGGIIQRKLSHFWILSKMYWWKTNDKFTSNNWVNRKHGCFNIKHRFGW